MESKIKPFLWVLWMKNLFDLTLDEIREKGIEQLPHTLRGSLEALIRHNSYLKPVMSDIFIDDYQHLNLKHKFGQ